MVVHVTNILYTVMKKVSCVMCINIVLWISKMVNFELVHQTKERVFYFVTSSVSHERKSKYKGSSQGWGLIFSVSVPPRDITIDSVFIWFSSLRLSIKQVILRGTYNYNNKLFQRRNVLSFSVLLETASHGTPLVKRMTTRAPTTRIFL